MKILLCAFGSVGDVAPVVSIAQQLVAMGHHAVVATSQSHGAFVEHHQTRFAPVRPDVDLQDADVMAKVMHPRDGMSYVINDVLMPAVQSTFSDLAAMIDEFDIVVSHPLTYVVPLICHQRGRPWVSLVLSPISMLSAFDPPVLAPAPFLARLRGLGPVFNRRLFAMLRGMSTSWTKPLHQLRMSLGVDPYGDPLWEGQHSPHRVLAMFSSEFARPQPDWPHQTVQCGFPDEPAPTPEMGGELIEFLQAGEAPLVFTLGSSAVVADGDFYRLAISVCKDLGCRAVFVAGGHARKLLNPNTRLFHLVAWTSYHELFPHARLVVHAGGIGTAAACLRAARPQLVIPFSHDQFDNAQRLQNMGVALVLRRSKVSVQSLRHTIEQAMRTPALQDKAVESSRRHAGRNGAVIAAQEIIQTAVSFAPNESQKQKEVSNALAD